MPTGMAEMPDATVLLCGGAHAETPEMGGMVGMGEIPEMLETCELETCVTPETTGTCETRGISGIHETCGTLAMFETFAIHGSHCMIATGTHGT